MSAAVRRLDLSQPSVQDMMQMTARLRSTLGKMELALGSLAEAIVWTGLDGRIQWCNSTFHRFARRPHLSLLGRPLMSILPLTQDGEPVDGLNYPAHRVLSHPDNAVPVTGIYGLGQGDSVRVLEVYCTALRSIKEDPCVVTVVRDVTEKHLAEEMLELETRRVELLRQVSDAANDTDSPEEALQVVLDSMCEHTGWPLGHAFAVGPGIPASLGSSGLWHDSRPGSFDRFRELTSAARFEIGQGLPGTVWESRGPVWIEEVALQPNFRRRDIAVECGIVSAFAFPILVGREVTAVIELFSTEGVPADDGLLRVVQQVGTQLGRVVERRRSQQAVIRAKRELESRVEERTAALQAANQALVGEIGQREIAQAALRDAMDRYRSLVQSVRDVIFAVSPRGILESLNPAFEELTGARAGAWIQRRCLRLIHPDDRQAAFNQFRTLMRGETPPTFELRVRRERGDWTLVECSMSPRYKGGVIVSLLGIARDITERRRAEAQLILQDRAMSSTSEGILITDAVRSGNPVVYANHGFERLTGFTTEEVIGRNCSFLQGPETAAAAVAEIRAAVDGERQCTVELLNYRKDGQPFWNRLSITPIRDRGGKLTHFIGVQSDISAQKEAERLKNELVSTVSHELRTPLTSLRGFAELMLERDFTPEKRRKFLEIIHREATRLSNLINDFLDVQRMESGRQDYHFERVSVALLIQEAMALFAGSNPNHLFSARVPADLPIVKADADRIRQVLSNLTANAVKFSPHGGTVTLSAEYRHAEKAVSCAVRDEGIGIPPDAIPKLFGKFYRVDNTETRKIGGTGLGLSVVKQIIEAHKGTVSVDSKPGEGSTFRFTIPVAS